MLSKHYYLVCYLSVALGQVLRVSAEGVLRAKVESEQVGLQVTAEDGERVCRPKSWGVHSRVWGPEGRRVLGMLSVVPDVLEKVQLASLCYLI